MISIWCSQLRLKQLQGVVEDAFDVDSVNSVAPPVREKFKRL